MVRPAADMPLVNAITRTLLRRNLVARGWFADPHLREATPIQLPSAAAGHSHQLPSEFPSGEMITDAGYKHEHRRLQALQNKGLLNFNRNHVWLT
jgi:hypothetical protein